MPAVHVYEPALCCNTGVCGPDLDQALVTFTADLDHVTSLGLSAARHNLANDPQAFAQSQTVRTFLETAGSAGLPLTLVDDVTVLTGRYPTREELLRWAAPASDAGRPAPDSELQLTPAGSESCCGSSGCC